MSFSEDDRGNPLEAAYDSIYSEERRQELVRLANGVKEFRLETQLDDRKLKSAGVTVPHVRGHQGPSAPRQDPEGRSAPPEHLYRRGKHQVARAAAQAHLAVQVVVPRTAEGEAPKALGLHCEGTAAYVRRGREQVEVKYQASDWCKRASELLERPI